jgi:hypothetical protein
MSIYSEVLRMAIASQEVEGDVALADLLDRLSEERVRLLESARADGEGPDLVERMALELAHDVALVHLCSALGIAERLTDPGAPLDERERLLRMVGAHQRLAGYPQLAGLVAPPAATGQPTPAATRYSRGWDLRH